MKYPRIFNAVHFQPWLIQPAFHATIATLLDSKLGKIVGERPSEGIFGEELPVMDIRDGVARVPVCGVIGKGLGAMEKSCGAVGVEDIANDLKVAMADSSVKAIFLDFDSPGGTVSGVPELGRQIAAAAKIKPVMAYASGMMCSAAYWLAAGATAIYASESADVGSIGVYLPWIDQTLAYTMRGLKVELIKNEGATYKGAGYPGTSLTDDQRADFQRGVDQVFAMFTGHVTAYRKRAGAEAMRGQTFMSEPAVAACLVDSIASPEEALRDLMKMGV